MNQSEVNEIARELILDHNRDYEYSLVYDHEDAAGWGEDNWIRIHDAMGSAVVSVSFDNEED